MISRNFFLAQDEILEFIIKGDTTSSLVYVVGWGWGGKQKLSKVLVIALS